ncbi:MAG: SUMF1/EgtB/PvdO family nonheme iron enzyme, partial [Bacteroidota bacterium]
ASWKLIKFIATPDPDPLPTFSPPEMVEIPAGSFLMGDDWGEEDERPQHEVQLDAYAIAKYETTNAAYAAFLNAMAEEQAIPKGWIKLEGSYKGEFCRIFQQGDRFQVEEGYERHPVLYVSWFGALAYAEWVAKQMGEPYRLPTEAEWERAAGGGKPDVSQTFAGSYQADEVAWHHHNSEGKVHRVGRLAANELGLHDMAGNVWEWCLDRYDSTAYADSSQVNPLKWTEGEAAYLEAERVFRGGAWYYHKSMATVANRNHKAPDNRSYSIGFRLARGAAITLDGSSM